ncbi:MAG: hypothetical protein ABIT83_10760 [Massilia sp.]
MESPGAYNTVSIAATDAGTLVLQAFMFDSRILSCTFPLSEIAACGAKDVPRCMGGLVVGTLSGMSPALQRYPNLLRADPPRQLKHATLDAPPTRPAHMRTSVGAAPERLIFQRCTSPGTVDATVATLLLARLGMGGVELAGRAMLRAMVALHPDAFAPFPELMLASGAIK